MRRTLQLLPGLCLLAAGAFVLWPGEPAGRAADKPAHKSYEETIPGTSVKFEMIAIPGGTFVMGSPNNEPERNADEGPQHPVTIRPFWMEKCETTWDEYDCYWKKEEGEEKKEAPKDPADAV